MSLGALELQSLFRKYQGELADIDLSEAENNRAYNRTQRDLRENRRVNRKGISDSAASQGLSHSGIHLENLTDLEKAYDRAGSDAQAQQQANLARLQKQRLDSKARYDEGVALSKMTSLLEKREGI